MEFKPNWLGDNLTVSVPSHRANDINIPEDLVEEIARIYGYHNLPTKLMSGNLPDPLYKTPFSTEWKIKNILKALGGIETYTLSLVPKKYITVDVALKIKNPLGDETQYLRTDLSHSLIEAVKNNIGNYEKIFIFEMSNVYIPNKNNLPDEKMLLGMCFDGYKYTEVKGVIETLLGSGLHIESEFYRDVGGQDIQIRFSNLLLGNLTDREDGLITIEMEVEKLIQIYKEYNSFKPIPKHPPQIEDITINIPAGVEVGKIIGTIKSISNLVSEIELRDIYKDSYTFRISYLDPEKTLIDKEVEVVRTKINQKLKSAFGINLE